MSVGMSCGTGVADATASAARASGASDADGASPMSARGNSRVSAATSTSSDDPTSTKQSPRPVAATRIRPIGDGTVSHEIDAPSPPRPYVAGVIPGSRIAPETRLGDPDPASQ